jgi:hypothetical protein
MNPFKLEGKTQGGKAASVWCCGECKCTCVNEAAAVRCCTCTYCGKPIENRPKGQYSHPECQHAEWEKRVALRLEKAEKLEKWDGFVFWGNDLFSCIGEAEEAMADQLDVDEWPEYLYVAKPIPFRQLDAGSILENLMEDFDSEDEIQLKGVQEFRAACEAFNAANQDIQYFEEDHARAVKVFRPAEDE